MPLSMGDKFSGAGVNFSLHVLENWRSGRPKGQALAA
jgi:hypothetical protein